MNRACTIFSARSSARPPLIPQPLRGENLRGRMLVPCLTARPASPCSAHSASRQLAGSDLRSVLEAIGDCVWDWDLPQQRSIFFRKPISACWAMPTPTSAITWMSGSTACIRKMRSMRWKPRAPYLAGEIPAYESEHRMLCKDGSWKWLHSRGALVAHTSEGRPARMMGPDHTDITQPPAADRRTAKKPCAAVQVFSAIAGNFLPVPVVCRRQQLLPLRQHGDFRYL